MIVVLGLIAAIGTIGWTGVVTSSTNNVRSTEVKLWSSSFDLYKSRYGVWPVLPADDAHPVTLCLGNFTATKNKCGQYNSNSPNKAIDATASDTAAALAALGQVGKKPDNTAPPVSDMVVGPIAYVSQTTDASGNVTVSVKYISFFQGSTCPSGFTDDSSNAPSNTMLAGLPKLSTVACAITNNSFTYKSGTQPTPVPTPVPTPIPTPVPTPPAVTTNAATSIANTSATLNGNLTNLGNSSSVTVSFECGSTTSYGTNTTTQSMNATGGFTAFVTGTSGNTYHCRTKAVGSNGLTSYGGDVSFTLTVPPPAATPPVVTTNAASSISTSSATLNGSLTGLGNSGSVSVSFECGSTTSYGTNVSAGSRGATGAFSAAVTGTGGNTYHCRAKAVGSNGTTAYGGDVSFTLTQPSRSGQYAQDAYIVTTYEWTCRNTSQHVITIYSPPKCSSKTTCSNTSCAPAIRTQVDTYTCPAGTHFATGGRTQTQASRSTTAPACYYD